MDKKLIIKLFIGYAIVAFIVNYFIGSKKITPIHNSAVIRIDNKKIIAARPIALDLNIFDDPIKKNIEWLEEKSDNQDEYITLKNKNNTYILSPYTGSIMKHSCIHPISKKEITLFDYTELNLQENIPPLLLVINNKVMLNFDFEKEESINDKKIIFIKKYKGCIIKKNFFLEDNDIQCSIEIQNPENIDLGIMQVISQQQITMKQDAKQGGFCYTDEEKISKFFEDNISCIDQSVIIYPEIIGFQSLYTAQAVIPLSTSPFLKGYFDVSSSNNGIKYILERKLSTQTNESVTFRWFSGIKEYKIMNKVDDKLSLIMEYGWFSKLSQFFISFILLLAEWLGNLGLALLLFIVLTKLITIPFLPAIKENNKKSKEFQQKLEYIEAKYHDNPDKKNAETMELYKKYGIMPGFSGKIPQILNFIIILAFQLVFKNSVLLYEVPIGLWLKDARLPDPYYILPALFLFMMYLTINETKMKPMMKVAVLIFLVLLIYTYSFWPACIQLFVVGGVIGSYIEAKFLNSNHQVR